MGKHAVFRDSVIQALDGLVLYLVAAFLSGLWETTP
jgi:hypothetical protein